MSFKEKQEKRIKFLEFMLLFVPRENKQRFKWMIESEQFKLEMGR